MSLSNEWLREHAKRITRQQTASPAHWRPQSTFLRANGQELPAPRSTGFGMETNGHGVANGNHYEQPHGIIEILANFINL